MAKFTFTGDPKAPGTDPAECILGGVTFPFGEAVDVENKDLIKRLKTHSHFTEGETAPEPKKPGAKK